MCKPLATSPETEGERIPPFAQLSVATISAGSNSIDIAALTADGAKMLANSPAESVAPRPVMRGSQ